MSGTIDLVRGRLVVSPGRLAPELKEAGGRWDGRERAWVFPPYTTYAQTVKEMIPSLEVLPAAKRLFEGWGFSPWQFNIEDLGPGYSTIWEKLYPYQKEAIEFLYSASFNRPGSILALSPGLGKSAVSLITAKLLEAESLLVVSPLSLLATWERESRLWAGRQLNRAYGRDPEDSWTITNYDTAVRRSAFAKWQWDVVILDESILVKNRDTLRFKAMKALRASTSKIWLLSGFPVSRYVDDLWAQLHLIDPTAFRSYWRFTTRYCWLEETNWGTNIIGSREDRNIQNDFRDVMFVRHQKDVLPELPEYLVEEVLVELSPSQKKAHEELRRSFVTLLESGEEVSAEIKLTQLMKMQQITSSLANLTDSGEGPSSKHDAIVEMLEAESFELPAIVWTHWRPGAQALYNRLKKLPHLRVALALGGDQEGNESKLKAFADGQIDLLILSLQVGKFGLTLTNAKTVIYLDKTFNADDYVQSRQRVQRIGLDHRPLMITLKSPKTVDQLVEDNLAGKMQSISQVTNADLADLLRGL